MAKSISLDNPMSFPPLIIHLFLLNFPFECRDYFVNTLVKIYNVVGVTDVA